jgi:hypothetical protein
MKHAIVPKRFEGHVSERESGLRAVDKVRNLYEIENQVRCDISILALRRDTCGAGDFEFYFRPGVRSLG